MFLRGQTVVLLPLLAYVVVDLGSACTAVGVTPGASVDGSAFVSHSSDAEGEGDPRVYKVEAKTHKPGTLRPVFDYPPGLSGARKPPIGHIPQVARTHGYLRETYGMMNDKQVSIGESTTSSKSPIDEVQPASRGGTALLSAVTLTEIGLERCDTARCACETMGTLSEQFGFFQDAGTPTGEAFLVGDRNEVWIFHILPPLKAEDTYGAIWAAARVPDGHVTALPNTFTIRGIDLEDGANFLYSQSLVGAAEAVGGWRAGEALDFTKVFGAGEYGSKYYSGRRVWRALTLLGSPEVAASLPAEYGDLHADAPYPPSVRATPRSVALSHVLAVHRDYYQGTKYDLSKGLAAGPWGTPNRFMFPADSINAWERSITLFRTVDSYVAQSRSWLADEVGGTIWYGPHAAHGTVYVPLSPAMAQATLPPAYTSSFEMTSGALDRRGAFWAHAATQALAEGRFAWIQPELSALQAVLEKEGLQAQATVDTTAAAAGGPMFDGDKAQARYAPLRDHASRVAAQCWQLFDQLVFRYADGFVRPRGVRASPVGMGYVSARRHTRSLKLPRSVPTLAYARLCQQSPTFRGRLRHR